MEKEIARKYAREKREEMDQLRGYDILLDDTIERTIEDAIREYSAVMASRRPKIVCLCGSTRFYTTFRRANYEQTMAGNIVLSVGFYPHAQDQAHGEQCGVTPEQKIALDELHKRKIDLADEVLVLNVGGYVGDSTRSEIDYAISRHKPVRYLESIGDLILCPVDDIVRCSCGAPVIFGESGASLFMSMCGPKDERLWIRQDPAGDGVCEGDCGKRWRLEVISDDR